MDEHRVCPQCGEEKLVTDFYRKNRVCKCCSANNSKQYYKQHKDEITAYKRKWYRENLDKVKIQRKRQRETARLNEQKRREKLFELYKEIKTPCVKCGENRLYVIEFHHIDPNEKEHTISQMRNLDLVREEAKKCICLCANCHAEFHHFYGKHPKDPIKSLEEYTGRRFEIDES